MVRVITTSGNLPQDRELAIGGFLRQFQELENIRRYAPCNIINFDQTNFFLDPVVRTTIARTNSRHVPAIGVNNQTGFRSTVCLGVTLSGAKLAPFLIFKGKKCGRISREFRDFPQTLKYATSEKAWMDEELVLRYIDDVSFFSLIL